MFGVDFDEMFDEQTNLMTPEEHIQYVLNEINRLREENSTYRKVVQDQDQAIVMLKDFIVKHGLPAFWEDGHKNGKSIKEMSKEELIIRNKEVAQRIKPAARNVEALAQPTVDELEKTYKEDLTGREHPLVNIAKSLVTSAMNIQSSRERQNEEE